MFAYIVRRILATIPVMAVVALFVFSLLYIAPGDPAAVIAGDQATPEDVERIRAEPRPRPAVPGQLRRMGRGRSCTATSARSIFTDLPVTTMIAQRIEPTLSLMVVTLILVDRRSPCRSACSRPGRPAPGSTAPSWRFAVFGFSVPVFVVGYLLAYVFALELEWLPVQGYTPIARGLLAVAGEPDPAVDRARLRLHRADRPHHARDHARGAAAGLHPHRARQGPGAEPASCSSTR